MAKNPEIRVEVGTEGVPQAIAAMRALRSSVGKVSGDFGGLKTSVGSAVSGLKSVASSLGGVGIAATGLTAASVAGLIAGLEKSKAVAQQVATELNNLERISVGSNTSSASAIGGLGFAFETLGGLPTSEGIAEVEGIGGAMVSALLDIKKGGQDTSAAMEKLGAYWSDFFDPITQQVLGYDKIFINLSRRVKEVGGTQNILETLIPLVGDADAQKVIKLLQAGPDAIQEQISIYQRLTGIRDKDIRSSVEYASTLSASAAAAQGLRVAFSRDLIPALDQTERAFQDFAVRNQGAFQIFGGYIGGFITEIQPLLLEVSDTILQILSGQGAAIADTPIKSVIEGIIGAVSGLAQALKDVLSYLTTGETDAAWLKNTINFFSEAKRVAVEFYDAVVNDIIPFMQKLISGISDLWSRLGVDSGPAQFGATAGLVIFGGQLASVVGGIGTLLTKLGLIPVAAAGAAAALPGLAAGYLTMDSRTDFNLDAASGQFEALSEDLDLTYNLPSITGRFASGIASGTGIRGMLIYRGVNARGVKCLLRLHDVELRPTGARNYISDTDTQIVELSGTAYPVGGQPEGFAIGYETDISDSQF